MYGVTRHIFRRPSSGFTPAGSFQLCALVSRRSSAASIMASLTESLAGELYVADQGKLKATLLHWVAIHGEELVGTCSALPGEVWMLVLFVQEDVNEG